MPNPEEGFFHIKTPRGPGVKVGEEFHFRLSASAELLLRVQCLERAISRVPIVGQDYARELREVGLQRLELKLPATISP